MQASRLRRIVASLAIVGLVSSSAMAEPAVGWRSDGSGRYPDATPPLQWSAEKNIAWKTPLPGRSFGSPVVEGSRVFVVSNPSELICLDTSDGRVVWQRSAGHAELYGEQRAEEILASYKRVQADKDRLRKELNELRKSDPDNKSAQDKLAKRIAAEDTRLAELRKTVPPPPNRGGAGNAAATVVSDGRHVFAVFGTGIIAAYRLDGERLWIKYVEASTISFGHSSSPVLADGKLLVHFKDLVALDAQTGKEVWRAELAARHATSIVTRAGGVTLVVSPAGAVVRAADGKVLLNDPALRLSECSPILHDGILYTQSGKIRALRMPTAAGESLELEPIWEANAARGRRTPSPVYHDGLVYGVTTQGILDVNDARTGEVVYRKRLDFGNVYASLAVAGDRLYLSNTAGTTLVLKPGPDFEELARNELESFGSTPTFLASRIYIRARKHLYCIGK